MGLGAGDGLRARCPECGDGKWELRTEEGQRVREKDVPLHDGEFRLQFDIRTKSPPHGV